jgi:hypothetical protein
MGGNYKIDMKLMESEGVRVDLEADRGWLLCARRWTFWCRNCMDSWVTTVFSKETLFQWVSLLMDQIRYCSVVYIFLFLWHLLMTFIVSHLQTNINMRKLNSLQVILRTTLLNVKILFMFNLCTCVELSDTFYLRHVVNRCRYWIVV